MGRVGLVRKVWLGGGGVGKGEGASDICSQGRVVVEKKVLLASKGDVDIGGTRRFEVKDCFGSSSEDGWVSRSCFCGMA